MDGVLVAQPWETGVTRMATSAGLRSGFEYELEYDTSAKGLDEFEPEVERAAFTAAEQGDAVDVRLNWLEGHGPSRRRRRFVMPVAGAAVVAAAVAWFVTTQSVAWVGTTSSVVAPAPNAPSAPAPPVPSIRACVRSVASAPGLCDTPDTPSCRYTGRLRRG